MGKDPNLVYLGSYLVNAHGGCNGCHTCPSYTPTSLFTVPTLPQSPISINVTNFEPGTPFPNGGKPFQGSVLTTPNLTPNSAALPAGLAT